MMDLDGGGGNAATQTAKARAIQASAAANGVYILRQERALRALIYNRLGM